MVQSSYTSALVLREPWVIMSCFGPMTFDQDEKSEIWVIRCGRHWWGLEIAFLPNTATQEVSFWRYPDDVLIGDGVKIYTNTYTDSPLTQSEAKP